MNYKRTIFLLALSLNCFAATDPVHRDLYTRFTVQGLSPLPPASVHASADGLYITTDGIKGGPFPEGQKYRIQLYKDRSKPFGAHQWCFQRIKWEDKDDFEEPAPVCPAPNRSESIIGDDGKTVIGQVIIDSENNLITLRRNASAAASSGVFEAAKDDERVELKVKIIQSKNRSELETRVTLFDKQNRQIASFNISKTEINGKPDLDPEVVDLDLRPGQEFKRNKSEDTYEIQRPSGWHSPRERIKIDPAR